MMSIRYIGVTTTLVISIFYLFFQEPAHSSCTIVDINEDSGLVVIRDIRSGWLKSFRPSALEFAELNIGDSVEASVLLQQVSRVRKTPRVYPLLNPFIGDPCCKVVDLKRDSTEALVTARNAEGGDLRFSVPDSLRRWLLVDSNVFTSPTHGFAMFVAASAADSTKKVVYGFPLLPNVNDSLQ